MKPNNIQRIRVLRRMILGGELNAKCRKANATIEDITARKIQIVNDSDIQKRIAILRNEPISFWKDCSENQILEACAIKSSNDDVLLREMRSCSDIDNLNKQFYTESSENIYYDKFFIDCEESNENLAFFQDVEQRQQEHFTSYLTLEKYGCEQKFKYVILYNIDDDILGGVCQYSIQDNMIVIHYLTSRSATSREPRHKGIGTTILNCIRDKYENEQFLGINLISDEDATKFYESYGFVKSEQIANRNNFTSITASTNYTFPFKLLTNISFHNPLAKEILMWAIRWKNYFIVSRLISEGVVLSESQRAIVVSSQKLIGNFWNQIEPNWDDLNKILDGDNYETVHLFLRNGFKLTEKQLEKIFLNLKADNDDLFKILNYYFIMEEQVDNYLFIICVFTRKSVSLVRLFLDYGYSLNDIQRKIAREKLKYNSVLSQLLGLK